MMFKQQRWQRVRSVEGGHVIPEENSAGIILLGRNDCTHRKTAMCSLSQTK